MTEDDTAGWHYQFNGHHLYPQKTAVTVSVESLLPGLYTLADKLLFVCLFVSQTGVILFVL